MVAEKYGVRLSVEDREQLRGLIHSGRHSARVINRARILLKTDEGWSASQVAVAPVSSTGQALDTSPRTVFRTKRRYANVGTLRRAWTVCCTTIPKPIGIASRMIGVKPI